jgi:hypothetical protein
MRHRPRREPPIERIFFREVMGRKNAAGPRPRFAAVRSIHRLLAVSSLLVPKREFDSIPESKFIVDGAKVICDDVPSRAQGVRNLTVLEPLRDELDD